MKSNSGIDLSDYTKTEIPTEVRESSAVFISVWRQFAERFQNADITTPDGLAIGWPDVPITMYNNIFLVRNIEDAEILRARVHEAASFARTKRQAGLVTVCHELLRDQSRFEVDAIFESEKYIPAIPLTGMAVNIRVFLSTHGDESVPDCQFEFAPVMYFNEGLSSPSDHAFTITTTILKPTSRGSVALRSARPDAKPRICHNFLATDYDRATLIASVRLVMNLFAQPHLAKIRRAAFSVPASNAEADIVGFIQQRTGTNYHPTCTCAIGRVVDSDLRVLGTEGLRVVDASVMPSIVRGNTNAAVIAIAEKVAAIVLGATENRASRTSSEVCRN